VDDLLRAVPFLWHFSSPFYDIISGIVSGGHVKLVKSYVGHLKDTLTNSPLPQQDAFIHSFVKEVEVTRKVLLTHNIAAASRHSRKTEGAVVDTIHYGRQCSRIDKTFELLSGLVGCSV
jgi:hypothetical protein